MGYWWNFARRYRQHLENREKNSIFALQMLKKVL
jgi:hypothetical protein